MNEFAEFDEPVRGVSVEVEPSTSSVSGCGNIQARQLVVRSKLGEALYRHIEKDLPRFYSAVRDAALGDMSDPFLPRDRRGNVAKSAGSYLSAHRKMFIDLMKMANADVDVSQADFAGDIEIFKEQLRELSTKDLRDLVESAPGIEEVE